MHLVKKRKSNLFHKYLFLIGFDLLNQKPEEELFPIFRHAWEAIVVLLTLYFLFMFVPEILFFLVPFGDLLYPELILLGLRIIILSLYFFLIWPKFRYPRSFLQFSEYRNFIYLRWPTERKDVFLGALTAGITILCSFMAVLLTGSFEWDLTTILPPTSWNILLSLVPGIFEEICFRGIILAILLRIYRDNTTKAIVILSLIFGGFHFTNLITTTVGPTIIQVVISILGGLVFGFLTVKTKSLLPAMISHYLIDVFAPFVFNAPEANLVLYGILLITIGFLLSTYINIKLIDFLQNKWNVNA